MNAQAAPVAVPVVVVGAGPAGVTVATLLAQYGIDVLVLDRWDEVYPQPRAVHLDDEVYRIIARLGLADEFASISRPSEGLRLQDANHKVIAVYRRDQRSGRHGFPQANMFDQPELEQLLRTNMQRFPNITFRGNVEVTDIYQPAPDGPVRVDLTDRVTGEEQTLEACYVLGCDGANSIVRDRIGARMEDLHFEQRWLVVDVNTSHDLGQWEGAHQVCDGNRAGTYMRINDQRYRWEFQLKDDESHEDFSTLSALRSLIQPWIGSTGDAELELVRVAEYTFRAQLANQWSRGNIFLLGDAAHLTPPFIGQGMGAGFRDAMNLAWKLAGVLNETLPPSVLDTYQSERRPHARHMILLAIVVGTVMTNGGRLGDVLRKLVAPRLHLVPGLQDRVLDSATPRLRCGSLVSRNRFDRGLAGTLCPNAVVNNGQRYDSVVDGRFALVTTGQPTPELQAICDSIGATVVTTGLDHENELSRWLAAGHAAAALVRPDGTVAAATADLNRVDDLIPVALRRHR